MNKVVTINLRGNAFQIEEGGYEALRAYLASAARTLEGNPDRDEIIADIEQAIADKCRAAMGPYKTVVTAAEIERIIAEMGPVRDDSEEPGGPGPAPERPEGSSSGPPPGGYRRLYRIREGSKIAGVCNGLAAHFDLDPTIVRLVVCLLALVTAGLVVAAYLIFWLVVPVAETPEERAAAYGPPPTAREFVRRAKQGYYEGMRAFTDGQAHREWRRKFRREMRGWSRAFRREMRWQARWWSYHGPPPPNWPARGFFAGLFLGLLAVCRWALGLAFLAVVFSFIFTGAVFGVVIFHGLSFWLSLVVLIIAYELLVSPLKIMQHSVSGRRDWDGGWDWPFDILARLILVVFLIWLACHLFPGVREALRELPWTLRQIGDSLRQWWNSARS